jgi:hypothetical protein
MHILTQTQLSVSYVIQDAGLITQLDRMEMEMQRASSMVEALCDAEGIDVTSVSSETQSDVSHVSSPQPTSDIPLPLEYCSHEIDG